MNIGFLVPWPLNSDLTAYWVLWASVATAVGTGLLAWFAWLAWQSAKETLKGQQNAIELEALGAYVQALSKIENVLQSAPASFIPPPGPYDNMSTAFAWRANGYRAYVVSLCAEVKSAGAMWRFHHPDLQSLRNEFVDSETSLCDAEISRLDYNDSDAAKKQFDLNEAFARELSQCAMWWQNPSGDRADTENHLSSVHAKFIRDTSTLVNLGKGDAD